jgi:hypothetical protein
MGKLAGQSPWAQIPFTLGRKFVAQLCAMV